MGCIPVHALPHTRGQLECKRRLRSASGPKLPHHWQCHKGPSGPAPGS
eukprot:gene42410-52593_t